MNRQLFLAQADVAAFVKWLGTHLNTLPMHLRFSASAYVKGGIDRQVVGIENVQALYQWATSWTDPQTGQLVSSSDWSSTRTSLLLLRDRLLSALAKRDETETYNACLAVLKWGGVRGAVAFLNGLQQKHQLVKYLEDCRPLFELDGEQSLTELDENSILRFDAGLTKIHALIDLSGSPIYDSRVGAAIAMLYALYRQSAETPPVLNFPSGTARGKQIRDPGEMGYQSAPQFFSTRVSRQRWAQCQVELGWIIREVLTQSDLFAGSLEERCHAFEAALFMVGYDLRCFAVSPLAAASQATEAKGDAEPVVTASGSTWVPTSVPFAQVLQDYARLSTAAGQALDLPHFREWLVESGKTINTARAYCSPLRASEFDLPSHTLDNLKLLAQGGEAGLLAASGGQAQFVAGDEREQVYLVDAFLAGRSVQIANENGLSPNQVLIKAGFAGARSDGEGASNVLLNVGKAVGKHFALLDNDRPTPLFERFFADSLDELDQQLRLSAQQMLNAPQP